MKKQEILNLIKEEFNEYNDFRWNDKLNKIDFEEVDDIGGEGDGAAQSYVLKFNAYEGPLFVKFDGRYSSWDSSRWQEFYPVESYEKTVRDWRKL